MGCVHGIPRRSCRCAGHLAGISRAKEPLQCMGCLWKCQDYGGFASIFCPEAIVDVESRVF
ncbi:hypothetical protein ppKF707_5517 [Metapseudomonas furukawaii]|uniref:Uncharacterized protein n=1 Tax=Metapseudomonas furukawaii TaxID=1149133 RepID=A0AAD1BVP9_METFU|nr:hypothetical protein ppKF707_5517 [Pseudomonas furukawaii]BAU71751.1 hypothetical protein KF707C_630 [Pseudomonas furukawaii]